MKPTTFKRAVVLLAVVLFGVMLAASTLLQRRERIVSWETMVNPGALSTSHAFLSSNCNACHTPLKGVEASNCIACHADDQSLLQRQPTHFHADVRSCTECHVEHLGVDRRPTQMDHAALSRIGLRQMKSGNADADGSHAKTIEWIMHQAGSSSLPPGHPAVSSEEMALSCTACHANEDPHRLLFGNDCIQCHTTSSWSIAEFRHPSPTSTDCVQCHQAPPSHYMMHFEMVSMKISGQEHTQVSECFKCHQTSSWNDIKGVGWYKHH